jgi:hypothetical protein
VPRICCRAVGLQQSAGGLVPVGPDVIRMAHCDAQHLGHLPEPRVPPHTRHRSSRPNAAQNAPPERAGDIDDETDRGPHTASRIKASTWEAPLRALTAWLQSVVAPAAPLDNPTADRRASVGAQLPKRFLRQCAARRSYATSAGSVARELEQLGAELMQPLVFTSWHQTVL